MFGKAQMVDVMFVSHASVGHTNPLASMAVRLQSEGHRVRFFLPHAGIRVPSFAPEIIRAAAAIPANLRSMGLDVATVRPTLAMAYYGRKLATKEGYEETRAAMELFTSGIAHFVRGMLRSLERHPADAVVADFAFIAGGIAADKAGVPWAAVYHSGLPFRGPGIPPMGSGLPIGAPVDETFRRFEDLENVVLRETAIKVNRTRAQFGLPPEEASDIREPCSPWLNLVVSHPCIEAPRLGLGTSCAFVGPCFSGRSGTHAGFPWHRLDVDAFKVYVSLGTVFNERPEVFHRILDALNVDGVQAIVSAGGAYDRLHKRVLPTNALVFRRVPQVELLKRIDLVIGHGGNNSTNETLATGKPLIILPVGGEQHDNGRRVEWLRVGRMLDINRFDVRSLRAAVLELRSDDGVRERLARIQSRLAQTDGPSVSARLIASLAATQKPVTIPGELASTVVPGDVARVTET